MRHRAVERGLCTLVGRNVLWNRYDHPVNISTIPPDTYLDYRQEILDLAERNYRRNCCQNPSIKDEWSHVRFALYDVHTSAPRGLALLPEGPDVILGADLFYDDILTENFILHLRHLLSWKPGAIAYIALDRRVNFYAKPIRVPKAWETIFRSDPSVCTTPYVQVEEQEDNLGQEQGHVYSQGEMAAVEALCQPFRIEGSQFQFCVREIALSSDVHFLPYKRDPLLVLWEVWIEKSV